MALSTAARVARLRGGRLVAVLGDMLELGAASAEAHAAVGHGAAAAGVALLVCVGAEMARAVERASAGGVTTLSVEDAGDVIDALRSGLVAGDVVLVKGSRSMRMERVVDGLTAAEPAP